MRESYIEGKVCDFAKANDILTMKLAGPNQRGQPDRMFLKDGLILFVEFKGPGKRARALQLRWLRQLEDRGFMAVICDNIEQGTTLLENFFQL